MNSLVNIQYRWTEAYFPFTHPSWELEIKTKSGYSGDGGTEEWTEILGCGIMRQELLERSGIPNKVGYAFGLGLERWAMQLYQIPDIRLFWSKDEGFLNQFRTADIHAPIKYKVINTVLLLLLLSISSELHLVVKFTTPENYA
ncbi:unnamed protein product [Trichobilharzia regenti]|nr:unnamed protein product [Trichobilharzia regenti]